MSLACLVSSFFATLAAPVSSLHFSICNYLTVLRGKACQMLPKLCNSLSFTCKTCLMNNLLRRHAYNIYARAVRRMRFSTSTSLSFPFAYHTAYVLVGESGSELLFDELKAPITEGVDVLCWCRVLGEM